MILPLLVCTALQGTGLNLANEEAWIKAAGTAGNLCGAYKVGTLGTRSEELSRGRPWNQSPSCPSMPCEAKSSIANDSAIRVF